MLFFESEQSLAFAHDILTRLFKIKTPGYVYRSQESETSDATSITVKNSITKKKLVIEIPKNGGDFKITYQQRPVNDLELLQNAQDQIVTYVVAAIANFPVSSTANQLALECEKWLASQSPYSSQKNEDGHAKLIKVDQNVVKAYVVKTMRFGKDLTVAVTSDNTEHTVPDRVSVGDYIVTYKDKKFYMKPAKFAEFFQL